jgi:hypothetical protein
MNVRNNNSRLSVCTNFQIKVFSFRIFGTSERSNSAAVVGQFIHSKTSKDTKLTLNIKVYTNLGNEK